MYQKMQCKYTEELYEEALNENSKGKKLNPEIIELMKDYE